MYPERLPGDGWIVLLGGGEFSFGETEAADRAWLAKLPGDAKVGFLPAASGSKEYGGHFANYLHDGFGREVETIPIYRARDARRNARDARRARRERAAAAEPWVVYRGSGGPGEGKRIVFVTGDEEYRSEEGMPLIARILAARLGFGWEGETKKLLLDALEGGCLQTVSGARIKKEWCLLLGEESRIASVRAMEKLNIADCLVGGLRVSTKGASKIFTQTESRLVGIPVMRISRSYRPPLFSGTRRTYSR